MRRLRDTAEGATAPTSGIAHSVASDVECKAIKGVDRVRSTEPHAEVRPLRVVVRMYP